MDQSLETEMELFRVALKNRNIYFAALKPELNSYFAETKFWDSGASFHVCCGKRTLQYQLQPPQPLALNDWMLTVSILNGRVNQDGTNDYALPFTEDRSKYYKPIVKVGVAGWIEMNSEEILKTSLQIASEWDELLEAELLADS